MPGRINVALEIVAAVSFLLTLWLLWQDRTASASVAVALSFGSVLFRVLPSLESFEILGLKAKLRERIEKVDEILDRLRRVATVFTKASVQNTTWSNRIGGLSYQNQAELLEEQVAELVSLGVASDLIDTVKRPALTMVSNDLVRHYCIVLEKVLPTYQNAYGRIIGELERVPLPDRAHDHAQTIENAKARQEGYSYSRYRDIVKTTPDRPEQVTTILKEINSLYQMSAADRSSLERFAQLLANYNEKIWLNKRMDLEVGDYLEKSDGERTFKEFFPNGPSGPDWDTYAS